MLQNDAKRFLWLSTFLVLTFGNNCVINKYFLFNLQAKFFKDHVRLTVKGGRGGDGSASMLSSFGKEYGGPDGGDGGNGGHVVFRVSCGGNWGHVVTPT